VEQGHGDDDAGDIQQCAICLENFIDGDIICASAVNVECTHQFHHVCIKAWCMKQSNCPCCRRNLLFIDDGTQTITGSFDSYRSDFSGNSSGSTEE
jgi:hypothetical protein